MLLILALVAAFGLSFPAEIGDDLWTLSPYSSCADDGNRVLNAPNLALRGGPDARLTGNPAPPSVIMGAAARNDITWRGGAPRPAAARAPSSPPPQRR